MKYSFLKDTNQIFPVYNEVEAIKRGYTVYDEADPEVVSYFFEQTKQKKIEALIAYDNSDNVNSFSLGGVGMWLDKGTRNQLALLANSRREVGETSMSIAIQQAFITLPITQIIGMLAQIEVYAGDCYNNTHSHYIAISNLNSVDAITEYDFTVGYPNKLIF